MIVKIYLIIMDYNRFDIERGVLIYGVQIHQYNKYMLTFLLTFSEHTHIGCQKLDLHLAKQLVLHIIIENQNKSTITFSPNWSLN